MDLYFKPSDFIFFVLILGTDWTYNQVECLAELGNSVAVMLNKGFNLGKKGLKISF